MPFKYVGHLEYQNAEIWYTAANGKQYQIPASYSGAYPGATRESQTVETDSITISIPGTASAQQWSFQAPASSHPAFEDMFAAQTDGDPRTFEVRLAERDLFEVPSGDRAVAFASIAITTTGVGTIDGTGKPLPVQFPVGAIIHAGVVNNGTAANQLKVIGFTPDDGDVPSFAERGAVLAAVAIAKVSMPGLQYGPFLASVDEIGQVDDTGVVMYGVSFTPSTVVGEPTQRFEVIA